MSGIRDLAGLATAGLVDTAAVEALRPVAARYAVAITPYLAGRLADLPADGPLARQYVPTAAEGETRPDERPDPIGDDTHSPVKGIVHRYPDRVLLKPLHACAVYCRFCFRREMVGPGSEALNDQELAAALAYIESDSRIWEVVVTGGDPFMLAPRRLTAMIRALGAIPHVAVVRFHTRVPVADPDRVNPALTTALRSHDGVTPWVAVHINHADEIDGPVAAALARLADAGIPLVGQSVLLKGVNDSAQALEALFRTMVRHRIKPYYLHHPDKAVGTAHFRPTLAEGDALVRGLRGRVSGLCQPTYVLDIPGGFGKVPAGSAWIAPDAAGNAVTDFTGVAHRYED